MENLIEEKRLIKENYYFFYQILPYDEKCDEQCYEQLYDESSHPNKKSFLKKIIEIMKNFNPFYRNPPYDEKFNRLKIFGAKFIKITNNGTLIVYSHSGELSSITKVSTPVDWIIKVVSLDQIMGNLLPPELIRIIAGFL
jgi:hypothetical protein